VKALCYLDGNIQQLADARIHPLDRGFLFGDALYEVVKVRSGQVFELAAHLTRLSSSLERSNMARPDGLTEACEQLVAASGLDTGYLYLQVSRGVAPRTHLPPPGMTPTVFILPAEYSYDEPAGRRMSAVTMEDPRWGHCDIKTTSLIATVLGKMKADREEAHEIVYLSDKGELREAGQTNLFVRRDDRLETHPANRRILAGVTRQLLIGFAREAGIELIERAPLLAERDEWREMLVCGTLTGVQPIVELDGQPVAGGEVGSFTRLLAEAHENFELEWLAGRAQTAGS
jgi:D-alanine transaminase